MGLSFLGYEPGRFEDYAQIGIGDTNNWSMSPQEGLFVCALLCAIRARTVVEVGTNIGHSSLYICHALRTVNHPDAVLHSFEISERAQIARAHLRRFGYDRFAHVHQCDSRGDEAARVRDIIAPLDAVLIDGDHSFEGSYADFLFWSRAVRPGGLIFFHDTSEEFEKTYLAVGLRSVFTTLRAIEERCPGYAIIRMEPPFYHNSTSMAVVQKAAVAAQPEALPPRRAEVGSVWRLADPAEVGARPWEQLELPGHLTYPVTMLQGDELKYLYWLARDIAPEAGAVVELGAWQGGSTSALCQGVRSRAPGERRAPVHVYDRFVWDGYSALFCPHVPLRPGNDMEELFRSNTRAWADLIHVHKGNVEDAGWDPSEPIGLLFVDAVTSPKALQHVWNVFGPRLLPGAVLAFQDFKHHLTSFLPALVPLLPSLRPVHVCRDGCTVSFRFEGEFRPSTLPAISREIVDEQFGAACEFFAWDPPTAAALQYGWIGHLLNLGHFAQAKERFERVKDLPVCAGAADAPEALAKRLAALA